MIVLRRKGLAINQSPKAASARERGLAQVAPVQCQTLRSIRFVCWHLARQNALGMRIIRHYEHPTDPSVPKRRIAPKGTDLWLEIIPFQPSTKTPNPFQKLEWIQHEANSPPPLTIRLHIGAYNPTVWVSQRMPQAGARERRICIDKSPRLDASPKALLRIGLLLPPTIQISSYTYISL